MKVCLFLLTIFGICSTVDAHAGSLRKRSLSSTTRSLRQLPPYPLDRFQVWSKLSSEEQKIVTDILGYKEDSWNLLGQNQLEKKSFQTIANLSSFGEFVAVDKIASAAVETQIDVIKNVLNITDAEVWDCHINHYQDFFWDELVNASVVTYVQALGWTKETYNNPNGPAPPSENKFWYELTDAEKAAAEALCYFPDLWAGNVEISDWVFQPPQLDDAATGSVDKNVTVEDRPQIQYWDLPTVPLTVWADLTGEQQGNATILGYNETTWNRPGIAAVNTSYIKWKDLTPANRSAAEALDLDEFYWDCLIQHYDNYQWAELTGKGVKHYFEALNWQYSSWHGIVAPPSSANQTYDQLGTGQKLAAKQLCFLPETYMPQGGDLTLIDLQALAPTARTAASPFS